MAPARRETSVWIHASLRKNPAYEILDFGHILGLDDLVIFYMTIGKRCLFPGGDMGNQSLLGIGLVTIFGGFRIHGCKCTGSKGQHDGGGYGKEQAWVPTW